MNPKGNPDISKHAAAGGHKVKANRTAAAAGLIATMPKLDSNEHARLSLEIIRDLTVNGYLTGSQAGAAVRAVDVYLRAEAQALDLHRIRELERTITELEAELKKARLRVS
jgi:hypothetical protein